MQLLSKILNVKFEECEPSFIFYSSVASVQKQSNVTCSHFSKRHVSVSFPRARLDEITVAISAR